MGVGCIVESNVEICAGKRGEFHESKTAGKERQEDHC